MPISHLVVFCIVCTIIGHIACRKSDYKRVIFNKHVADALETLYKEQYKHMQQENSSLIEEFEKIYERGKHVKLTRLQPENNIADVRNVTIEGNRKTLLSLRTVSKRRPLIFEIDDFLFDDECEHIKSLALKNGLEESLTAGDALALYGGASNIFDDLVGYEFHEVDLDSSSYANITEIRLFIRGLVDIRVSEVIVRDIMRKTLMDFNHDDRVEEWEWNSKNLTRLVIMLNETKLSNPSGRARFSHQTWLQQTDAGDPVLLSLQDRLQKVTGLPPLMIRNSEMLQVVRYTPGGHYDCHLDSDPRYYADNFKPCCHYMTTDDDVDCAACRFMTVLFYLDNTKHGGQTAFPVVGVDPYLNQLADQSGSSLESWCDLATNCRESKVRIHPKKGRAVLWYNHFLDPDTDWLGAVDRNSLHGGCAVHKGTKWIANNWFNAGFNKEHDMLSWLVQQADRDNQNKENGISKIKDESL